MLHKLLIVDDEPQIVATLTDVLESDYLRVYGAYDGIRAIEIILEERPDIVISDLNMPKLSGWELFEEAKRLGSDATFIFITGYGSIPDAANAVKKGVFDYVEKPFNAQRIKQVFNAAMEYHKTVAENEALRSNLSSLQGEYAQLHDILMRSAKIRSLSDFATNLTNDDSPRELLKKLLRASVELTGSNKGSVFLYTTWENSLSLELVDSWPGEEFGASRKESMGSFLPVSPRWSSTTVRAGVHDRWPMNIDELMQYNLTCFQNSLTMPIEASQTLRGVLYLEGKTSGEGYSDEDFINVSLLVKKISEKLEEIEFLDQRSFFAKDSEKLKKEYNRLQLQKASLEKSFTVLTILVDRNFKILKASEKFKELLCAHCSSLPEILCGHPLWSKLLGGLHSELKEAVRKNEIFIGDELLDIEVFEKPRLFKIMAVPLPGGGGEDDRGSYLILLEDITEYENIKRRLLTLENLSVMVKFLGSMAHDLNNPLDGLNRLLKILQSKVGDEVESDFFEMIYSGIRRMGNTIRHFLECTRDAMVKTTSAPLAQLLDEVLFIMSPGLADKNIHVRKETKTSNSNANVPTDLYNVFINIVKNAFDAMATDGVLYISIADSQEPNMVDVVFSDTGCGIPEEVINEVMTPYFTTKKEGMGLGLSLCRKIVTGFGGRISVRNREEGGCEVTISLKI
jgi:signal transduction histidine kinase/DNA-binding response OmpR family regulator